MTKKFLVLGFGFSVSDVINKIGFWLFLVACTWPGPNCYSRRKYSAQIFNGN